MAQEEKTITFGKFIRVAFGSWIRLLIIAGSICVVGTLGVKFGYNTLKGVYNSKFSYNRIDLNEDKYADGSGFYYTEMVSEENLKNVVESDPMFASLNLEKMLNNNAISFSRVVDDKVPVYTISIPKKYFSSQQQAKEFVYRVASFPINHDNELLNKNNYETNLIQFDQSDTFEDQISYLKGHAEALTNSYNSVIKQDQNLTASVQGIIQSNLTELKSISGEDGAIFDSLIYTIKKYGYVKDYAAEEVKMYDTTKQALLKEKETNTAKINELTSKLSAIGAGVILNGAAEDIATLTERNVEIDEQIAVIDLKKSHEGDTDPAYLAGKATFAQSLVNYRDKLSECTDSYVSFLKKLYGENTNISFENSSVIVAKEVSLVVAIALSLVVGVVVGGVVNLIVDRKKFSE